MAEGFRKRKKVCQMCAGKDVDYKNVEVLKKYIKPNGSITSTRMNGNCKLHQRHIANSQYLTAFPIMKMKLKKLVLWD